ncbi:hypothetical protein [Streptococcus respiraculi]|uniref:hypothetical protein n=1 Tax=Streptococcus respiraculi TaxID=2021971 RepID=UPI000E719314|nr:hypothetical protein [Streptococcus respiraculi]
MRSKVNIIWLEDKITGSNKRPHESRVKAVKERIIEKGYSPNINVVSDIAEARKKLLFRGGEQRYDFFISDFDLGGGIEAEKGLDYLVDVRKSENYRRFFVLYSRNEYSTISEKVIEKLKFEKNINLFTNFSFISIAADDNYTIDDIENKFKECIDIGLSRWDELNALRGMYMSEHAEIEQKLDNKSIYGNYEQKIDTFCKMYDIPEETKERWEEQRKLRNALAHVKEAFDSRPGKNCFFIRSESHPGVIIYEDELDAYRKKLIDFKDEVYQYLI